MIDPRGIGKEKMSSALPASTWSERRGYAVRQFVSANLGEQQKIADAFLAAKLLPRKITSLGFLRLAVFILWSPPTRTGGEAWCLDNEEFLIWISKNGPPEYLKTFSASRIVASPHGFCKVCKMLQRALLVGTDDAFSLARRAGAVAHIQTTLDELMRNKSTLCGFNGLADARERAWCLSRFARPKISMPCRA